MILQQKAQFDLPLIYLYVCVCVWLFTWAPYNAKACACLPKGRSSKILWLSVAFARCSAILGPADHSILSSPCGLCLADRTTWILESDLHSQANEQRWGIMKEKERGLRGMENIQLDECPLLKSARLFVALHVCFWCILWRISGCITENSLLIGGWSILTLSDAKGRILSLLRKMFLMLWCKFCPNMPADTCA